MQRRVVCGSRQGFKVSGALPDLLLPEGFMQVFGDWSEGEVNSIGLHPILLKAVVSSLGKLATSCQWHWIAFTS